MPVDIGRTADTCSPTLGGCDTDRRRAAVVALPVADPYRTAAPLSLALLGNNLLQVGSHGYGMDRGHGCEPRDLAGKFAVQRGLV
jgi:hypothetical protein